MWNPSGANASCYSPTSQILKSTNNLPDKSIDGLLFFFSVLSADKDGSFIPVTLWSTTKTRLSRLPVARGHVYWVIVKLN